MRVVKVDFYPLNGGQSTEVFVVGVVLKKCDPFRADALENFLGNGCFSRT
jgi:hypothetical protein